MKWTDNERLGAIAGLAIAGRDAAKGRHPESFDIFDQIIRLCLEDSIFLEENKAGFMVKDERRTNDGT